MTAKKLQDRGLTEKQTLDLLFLFTERFVESGLSTLSTLQPETKVRLISEMRDRAGDLPTDYKAMQHIENLLDREIPWFNKAEMQKEYWNGAWKAYVSRAHPGAAKMPSQEP